MNVTYIQYNLHLQDDWSQSVVYKEKEKVNVNLICITTVKNKWQLKAMP
jgi:hypothetical protein